MRPNSVHLGSKRGFMESSLYELIMSLTSEWRRGPKTPPYRPQHTLQRRNATPIEAGRQGMRLRGVLAKRRKSAPEYGFIFARLLDVKSCRSAWQSPRPWACPCRGARPSTRGSAGCRHPCTPAAKRKVSQRGATLHPASVHLHPRPLPASHLKLVSHNRANGRRVRALVVGKASAALEL